MANAARKIESTGHKVKQKEINDAAWAACDTFRGVLNPSDYKDYILVFLFVKYISDTWGDHYDEFKKQYGDDRARILRKMERERFVLPEGCSFNDLYEKRNEPNIGDLINIALEKIETANKSKLAGVFRNIDFNQESKLGPTKDRNRRLKNLLEDFANPKLDLRPSLFKENGGVSDIIGNTYIYLIERFAADSGKKSGEFYTPYEVSKLLARLSMPKAGDTICDPTCGSGSLLINAADTIEGDDYALFGQEVNSETWALSRMNMFLHGKDSARIEWGDTINNPKLIANDQLMKFNVVVANPPFSLDKWGVEGAESDQYNRFWRGVPPKSKGDYAFISHMVETALPKEGRVAVITPHGVLFRGGGEGRIRQKLIEDNLLDAVIGLPDRLFSTTTISVAILIFDRSREKGGVNEKRKDVLFIDGSRDFEAGKNQNILTDKIIDNIMDTYKARNEVPRYAHIASFDEIKENDFNLNITRYVDTFEEEVEIDVAAVQKEIVQLESDLEGIRAQMNKYLKELGVDV